MVPSSPILPVLVSMFYGSANAHITNIFFGLLVTRMMIMAMGYATNFSEENSFSG